MKAKKKVTPKKSALHRRLEKNYPGQDLWLIFSSLADDMVDVAIELGYGEEDLTGTVVASFEQMQEHLQSKAVSR